MSLVYLLAALIGITLTREGGNVAALWPPNALLIGVLLRADKKDWLDYLGACLVANGLANLLMGDTLPVALGFVLANASEVVTFMAIAWWLVPLPTRLKNLTQPLTLVVAGLVSAAAGATVGATLIHVNYGTPYWTVWPTWWIADVMGFAIIMPVILSASWSEAKRVCGKQRFESAIYGLLIIVITAQVFTQSSYTTLLYSLEPLLLWCSYRLGVFVCSLLGVTITAIAVTLTLQGSGPLNRFSGGDASLIAIQELQLYLGLVLLPAMIVGIEREKQQLAAAQLSQYRDHLEHTVEARTAELTAINRLLVNEKQRLALVLESLHIGVLLLDRDRHILLANKIARELVDRFATVDADQALQRLSDQTIEELAQCPVDDLNCREVTFSSYPKRVFEVTTQPLILDDRKREEIVVLRDISDRKRVEDEIHRALRQEQELNQLKSRVISTVSHEYRTPLTVILGAAQVLEKYSTQLSAEQKQHLIGQIERSARNLSELVDLVLLANKDESGALSFKPVPLEVISFCYEILEEVRLLRFFHHILIFDCDAFKSFGEATESDDEIFLDPFLLRQILINLLSNAIKFSPEGGDIVLALARESNQVIFEVKDQGMGIAVEEQPRLFEAFYRGRNSENIQGSGLGLNIVKKFVELHHGNISVESEDTVGTAFTVRLPC